MCHTCTEIKLIVLYCIVLIPLGFTYLVNLCLRYFVPVFVTVILSNNNHNQILGRQ